MAFFIPSNATIHYKSAFDIEVKSEDACTVIRKLIRKWCSELRAMDDEGREDLFKGWFFLGDSEQHDCGTCHIRIATNIGNFSKSNPQHWVFELIHPDAKVPARLWATNISLTRIDDEHFRLACLLRYAMRTDYIGPNLDIPTSSVPKIIKYILNDTNFLCSKNKLRLNSRIYDAGVSGPAWIAKQICNENRCLPIIVMAEKYEKESAINLEELQKRNIGNFNLYIISNGNDLNIFNSNLPYDCRIPDFGMLRIYLKYSPQQGSGKKHRFYTQEYIYNNGDGVIDEITFAMSKNSQNFLPNEVIEIRHVADKRRLHEIEEMRKNVSKDKDNEKFIEVLDIELTEKIKELSETENKLLETEIALEDAENEIAELSWKASQYNELNAKIVELEENLEKIEKNFDLPKNLGEVLELSNQFFGDKLEIHDNAIKSAKNYSQCANRSVVEEAWRMCTDLAIIMHSLKFIDKSNELEKSFKSRSGIEISMTESSATKKDKKFTDLRTCSHRSKSITYFPHLKSSARKDFRMHFSFLEDEEKILICHCGEHLDNARTRHIE